jgi:hypothetical protein
MKRNLIKLLVLSACSSAVLAVLILPSGIKVSAVENQTSGKAIAQGATERTEKPKENSDAV